MFRRIFCFCMVITIIGTLFAIQEQEQEQEEEAKIFSADRHKNQGIECAACHGEGEPAAPVSGQACLTCHESLEAVAEKTKEYNVNPHENHITATTTLECTECHSGHKADIPACQQCHQGMKFK